MNLEPLIVSAIDARNHAHADYSQFKVGAALQTSSGIIYKGCNIENASYTLGLCAERVALFKALSEGEKLFTSIAIVTDGTQPTTPCGACLQVLWEFCGNIQVILATLNGNQSSYLLNQFLPLPFNDKMLEQASEL